MKPTALVLVLAAMASLSACDRPKHRTIPPDPMATASALAVPAVVDGRTAGLRKRPEYPAAYLDHVGGALDPLKNRPAVTPAGRPTQFDGFAYDGLAGAPAKGVEVVLDGKSYVAEYGKPRVDVMTFTKNPALGNTGYVLVLPGSYLPAGPHRAAVRVIASDGASYYETPSIPFTAR